MSFFDDLFGSAGGAQSAAGATGAAVPPPAAPAASAEPPFSFAGGLMGPQLSGQQIAASGITSLGQSLMSSPSNDPLRGFGAAVKSNNTLLANGSSRQRLIETLRQMGKSDIEIQMLLASPQGLAALGAGDAGSAATTPTPALGGLGALSGGIGAPAPGTSFDPLLGPNSPRF